MSAPEMEYTTLGGTGLEVSRLCLGTMNFGNGRRPTYQDDWSMGEEGSLDVIERAIDRGNDFIDIIRTLRVLSSCQT